ncbi:metallophosphoesterase [Actinoplanes sp. NPDC049548]|uniref:metallophosphoesterase family protein n=1 Tax=Actinoplanes sp. NPDC049548 TaxID=3155152 RepID=UPI00341A8CA0
MWFEQVAGGKPAQVWISRPATALLVVTLAACSASAPTPAPSPSAGATPSSPTGSPPSSATSAVPPPAAGAMTTSAQAEHAAVAPAVLIGAGDIASCDSTGDTGTLALLQRFPGTVFTLGDNAYPDGSRTNFARCYGPTWGRVKARTRPVVGNHEYHSTGARPYFDYFGAAAGPRGRGYYSYEAGAWHVVVLNTVCSAVPGGCAKGSPQERWLRADLAKSSAACTVAMVHHPLFTSAATHPPATETRPLVQALYDAGVELLMAGHNHVYERFAPQTPAGRRDDARGIREIVAGTGGAERYPFGRTAANSERRNNTTYGVVRLTLRPGWFRWDFLPVRGGSFTDTGTGRCH